MTTANCSGGQLRLAGFAGDTEMVSLLAVEDPVWHCPDCGQDTSGPMGLVPTPADVPGPVKGWYCELCDLSVVIPAKGRLLGPSEGWRDVLVKMRDGTVVTVEVLVNEQDGLWNP